MKHDALGRDLQWGDIVAYMINHYDDRFDSFHSGTIVGFTPYFIKIRPTIFDQNNKYKYKLSNFVDGEWVPKDYILRQSNRVIKLNN